MRPSVLLVALVLAASLVAFPSGESAVVWTVRVLVAFEETVPEDLDAVVAPYGTVHVESPELAFAVVLTTDLQEAALLDTLRGRDDVVAADREASGSPAATPDDPRYGEQWALPAVRFPEAWDVTSGTHAVGVAVLDTGVDTDHPDLQANRPSTDPSCAPEWNFVSLGPNVDDESASSHGTHVLGIVAATTNNGLGVAGASSSCVSMLRVCDGGCKPSAIGLATVHAKAAGARIVTASIGYSPAQSGGANGVVLERAVDFAWNGGMVFVAAAGNHRGCPTDVDRPAVYANALAVSNLAQPGDVLSATSNCGPAVDVAAPGTDILSTVRGGYGLLSGTSMAAPLVAGVLALTWSADLTLDNAQVRCIVEATAFDLGPEGPDVQFGHGRVDARAAVDAAADPASVGC